MRVIGTESLWSYSPSGELQERKSIEIRRAGACHVKDYTELATKIAML